MTDNMPQSHEVLYKLGELSGKLDSVILSQHGWDEKVNSITTRVSALEQAKAYFLGISAAVGVAASFLTNIFLK